MIFCWMCNFYLIQGKNRRLKVRFVFCDFPRRDVKCRRYIQAFILHNIFICASNQNPLGLTVENVIFCWMCNFYLIQAKNRRLKVRFVFCDFPRRDVKCCRYIQAFILHNIFICASNQNPLGLTLENVIFCWMCNFYLIQAKIRRLKVRFVFCDFPSRDVKCRRYIQTFILHNIFICASNQNPVGLTVENMIFCWMCNFYLIQAKNRRLKVRFVFCEWSWSVAANVSNLSFERSNRINVIEMKHFIKPLVQRKPSEIILHVGFCTLLLPRGRDLYLMTFPGGRVFAYP